MIRTLLTILVWIGVILVTVLNPEQHVNAVIGAITLTVLIWVVECDKCFPFHCWHNIQDTRRLVVKPSKCKRVNYAFQVVDGSAVVKADQECCRCNTKRTYIYYDYDLKRASKYPTEWEYSGKVKEK